MLYKEKKVFIYNWNFRFGVLQKMVQLAIEERNQEILPKPFSAPIVQILVAKWPLKITLYVRPLVYISILPT